MPRQKPAGDPVIFLHQARPQQALESLRRVTGLQFFEWPESLAPKGNQGREATAGEAGELACGVEAEA